MFRWINNIGIQQRLLLLAILPVAITTLILGIYITTSRIDDINNRLDERGAALAKHIAPTVEFSLFAGDAVSLRSTTRRWLSEPDVLSISIYDRSGEQLTHVVKMLNSAVISDDVLEFRELIRKSTIIDSEEEFNLLSGADAIKEREKEEVLGEVRVELSSVSAREQERTVLVNSFLIMISGLLVSAILALRIGGTVANPIIQLTRVVELLRSGNFNARASLGTGGELQTLESGFNDMAATLQESQVDLQLQVEQATSDLREIVRELELKNEELDVARQQAIKSGQARLEFLAKMSHEIRTPVNAVIGFARLLGRTRSADEEEEYRHTIIQASNQLLSIIDDILNFSKMEYGTIKLENIPFTVRDVIEDVVVMHRPSAYAKGLDLVLNIFSDVPYSVFGDSTRVSQVLMNLLSNAIKFTSHGEILVQVEQVERNREQFTLFSVKDTGIGIGKLEGEKLFKAFSQVDTSITRRFGGTGLGLVIARRIIELMGGEVGFESEKGEGSTFWFTVPFNIKTQQYEGSGYEGLSGQQIAIFEENTICRRALRNSLISQGCQVFAFGNLEKLLEVLPSQQDIGCVVAGLSKDAMSAAKVESIVSALRSVYQGPLVLLVSSEDFMLPAALQTDHSIRLLTKPTRSIVLFSTLVDVIKRRGFVSDLEPALSHVDSAGSYKGRKILVAEDNDFNMTLITTLLLQKGIEVVQAYNGKEAIEQYLQNEFDLVFMDIHMPEMDGLEATNQIRLIESNVKHTPIVALTADVFIKERQNLRIAGLDDYLLKPFSEDALRHVLDTWFGQSTDLKKQRRDTVSSTNVVTKVTLPPELLSRLNEDIDNTITELDKGFELNDVKAAYEAAHKLMGTIGYFEIKMLMQTCRKLDGELKAGDIEQGRMSYEKLLAELEQFRKDADKES